MAQGPVLGGNSWIRNLKSKSGITLKFAINDELHYTSSRRYNLQMISRNALSVYPLFSEAWI